jgi:hypothetical protein
MSDMRSHMLHVSYDLNIGPYRVGQPVVDFTDVVSGRTTHDFIVAFGLRHVSCALQQGLLIHRFRDQPNIVAIFELSQPKEPKPAPALQVRSHFRA